MTSADQGLDDHLVVTTRLNVSPNFRCERIKLIDGLARFNEQELTAGQGPKHEATRSSTQSGHGKSSSFIRLLGVGLARR
jgi:hypothetical protein